MKKFSLKKILLASLGISFLVLGHFSSYAATSSSSSGTAAVGGTAAAGTGSILQNIADYTYGTLKSVNNLPGFLAEITNMATSWLAPDDSPTTSNLQAAFANYAAFFNPSMANQTALQTKLLASFFGRTNVNATTYPNANDLTYQNLIGIPYLTPDPRNTNGNTVDSKYNYVMNASGMNVYHAIPGTNWKGYLADQKAYGAFYSTVSAVQTYNGYILSKLYTESQGSGASQTQTKLISLASSSDWFAQIASEPIGPVLRQILMFDSQIFVLLTQLVSAQKQLLTSLSMMNTLIIAEGMSNEQNMLRKALAPSQF